jgi:aspartate/methionine/tyrosine aminotransferase
VVDEHVIVPPGAQCAVYSVAQCLLDPGDEVIVAEPMYVTYEGCSARRDGGAGAGTAGKRLSR